MNQQNQIQYAEQGAERMIRLGSVRRAQQTARLWMTVYILPYVIWLGGLAVFLTLIVKSTQSQRYQYLAAFYIPLLIIPATFLKKPLRTAMEAYRDAFLRSYGPFTLGTIFTNLQIRQGSGISWGTLAAAGTIYPGGSLESNSILRGQYRGIPFEQSEIRTIATVRRLYRSGPRYEDKTFFRGQWTVVPINGRFAPELQIIQRGFRNTKHRLSFLNRYKIGRRVFVKDLGFNLMFRVYAEDRDDVNSVLTPDAMKQIQNLANHTRGRLMICFVNGGLHIAVQTRRGTLRPPGVYLPFREERAVARMRREIAPFTQLIDELSRDGKPFRHEEVPPPAEPAEEILWLD